MNNELVKIDFNQETIDLIKSQIAPKATDDELKLFIYQSKRTGLDPLARQIYAIHRKSKDINGNWVEKMSIQTSIDGFRVIAERSGDYAGQDEPLFIKDENDLYCKVTVYRFRNDIRYPAAVGVAYWSEYCPKDKEGKPSGLWAKMPHTMLSKVAEALALRKAYPQDLSGLYTTEEMQQTDDHAEKLTKEESEALKKKMENKLNNINPAMVIPEAPTQAEKDVLMKLVANIPQDDRGKAAASINAIKDYNSYKLIEARLLELQPK
jgi:phage recombination protein Bet